MHIRFSHASAGEMKRFLDIKELDIDHWYNKQGHFCSGFAEGKMKEHARMGSTKPLRSEKPGGVMVGDIM